MNTSDQNNPDSLAMIKAKKQTLWQIIIPVCFFAVLIILAAVLMALNVNQNSTGLRHWADLSTILILMPVMLFTLVSLILLIGLIIGVAALTKVIPKGGSKLRGLTDQTGLIFGGVSDLLAQPIIQLKSTFAVLQGLLLSLIGKSKRG